MWTSTHASILIITLLNNFISVCVSVLSFSFSAHLSLTLLSFLSPLCSPFYPPYSPLLFLSPLPRFLLLFFGLPLYSLCVSLLPPLSHLYLTFLCSPFSLFPFLSPFLRFFPFLLHRRRRCTLNSCARKWCHVMFWVDSGKPWNLSASKGQSCLKESR